MSFKFNYTPAHTRALLSGNSQADSWHAPIMAVLPKFEIDTALRVAGFMAQAGHESNNFGVLIENLNYSADGLNKTFPKYFKNAGRDAALYARQPAKIANVVYADRMGNGNIASGDGWRFRGRGVIQLTGRDNYTAFARSLNMTLEQAEAYLNTQEGALASGAWFWRQRNINSLADAGDIVGMSKAVNGGTNGLDDRKRRYASALTVLRGSSTPVGGSGGVPVTESGVTLAMGSRGPEVKRLQVELNVTPADGIFGPATERAVRTWQAASGLKPTGRADSTTLQRIYR